MSNMFTGCLKSYLLSPSPNLKADAPKERVAGTTIRGAIAARENEPTRVRGVMRDELSRQARDEAERSARTADILKVVT